jgi:hypothetical protein
VQSPGLFLQLRSIELCLLYDGLNLLGYPEDDPVPQRIGTLMEELTTQDVFTLTLQLPEIQVLACSLDYLLKVKRTLYFDDAALYHDCLALRDRLST